MATPVLSRSDSVDSLTFCRHRLRPSHSDHHEIAWHHRHRGAKRRIKKDGTPGWNRSPTIGHHKDQHTLYEPLVIWCRHHHQPVVKHVDTRHVRTSLASYILPGGDLKRTVDVSSRSRLPCIPYYHLPQGHAFENETDTYNT